MVGRMAVSDPETVKEVAAQGHTVATHTWSHVKLDSLAEDKVQAEIELGFSAVQQALGKPVAPFFRFPYLRDSAFSLRHLDGRQIATFSIDIDSRDFEIRDAAALHERVIADVKSRRKGIILFHDIHTSTARALPRILADLKSLGLRVVHLAPKTGARTVAEYDTLARQALTRRRLAIARSPLAKRAVTWPMAGLQDAKVETKDTKEAKVAEDAAPTAPDATAAPSAPPAPKEDWTCRPLEPDRSSATRLLDDRAGAGPASLRLWNFSAHMSLSRTAARMQIEGRHRLRQTARHEPYPRFHHS